MTPIHISHSKIDMKDDVNTLLASFGHEPIGPQGDPA